MSDEKTMMGRFWIGVLAGVAAGAVVTVAIFVL